MRKVVTIDNPEGSGSIEMEEIVYLSITQVLLGAFLVFGLPSIPVLILAFFMR